MIQKFTAVEESGKNNGSNKKKKKWRNPAQNYVKIRIVNINRRLISKMVPQRIQIANIVQTYYAGHTIVCTHE